MSDRSDTSLRGILGAEVVTVRTRKSLVLLGGEPWFTPMNPDKGRPVIKLPTDPMGRSLMCAFTTREKCQRAIDRWFPSMEVTVVDDPIAMNNDATSKGYTVAVDLDDDGEEWHFSEFARPTFSPGGDC